MTTERTGSRELALGPKDLAVDAREVARLASCGPAADHADAIDSAIAEARDLFCPRARVVPLPATTAAQMFPEPTPVEEIVRAGECWAFVVTLGGALETRVRELFDAHLFLEAVLLDAVGSVAADALAERVERECAAGRSSARFSPGYCHWSMPGQRALFAALDAEEIGVSLLPSMLMNPLKSVSGVVVVADPEALLVPRAACRACDARCERRRARFAG